MTATETTPSLSFDELLNLPDGTYLKFSIVGPLSHQLSAPIIWQIADEDLIYRRVKVYAVTEVDADSKNIQKLYLTSGTLDIVTENTPITIPTPLEIEEAKRQREANLIKALEARIAADTGALAKARERWRLLDPNTTT